MINKNLIDELEADYLTRRELVILLKQSDLIFNINKRSFDVFFYILRLKNFLKYLFLKNNFSQNEKKIDFKIDYIEIEYLSKIQNENILIIRKLEQVINSINTNINIQKLKRK